jgi:phosphoribosyl 1,2-cyclic phosphodiesterase
MSLRFQIMGSSSAGNCALIETGEVRVLLDAGFSGKKITEWLKLIGKPIETIDSVLLTHEHGDHIRGLRGLSKCDHLNFYANYGTAQVIQQTTKKDLRWKIFETGHRFRIKNLEIETVKLPHDAMEPVGYIFRSGSGTLFEPHKSIAWMTDLGFIPLGFADLVREVDVLVLESNHDTELLETDEKRPFSIKQRIMGRHGHLSNEAAFAFLEGVENPRWSKVLLGHISKDCNCLERVKKCFAGAQTHWNVEALDPSRIGWDEFSLLG